LWNARVDGAAKKDAAIEAEMPADGTSASWYQAGFRHVPPAALQ
jgi:hypothetical protein